MRRPRCGTCRHWIADEGGAPFCAWVPPSALDKLNSTHPVAAPWGGCAQHRYHVGRALKAVWARLRGLPGNDPKRINRAHQQKQLPSPQ